ncbi:MAG: hypothetical protein LC114_10920 [Bryobacterales bacterium]|nr:hypothetical protein [Bryobacterales bacterium]
MIVRIRLRLGPTPRPKDPHGIEALPRRGIALAAAALLSPASLVTFVLSVWSLAADLNFAGSFSIQEGLFSRWQTWLLLSILLQAVSLLLNRYGDTMVRSQEPKP